MEKTPTNECTQLNFTVKDQRVILHIPFKHLPKLTDVLNDFFNTNGIESYIEQTSVEVKSETTVDLDQEIKIEDPKEILP